MCNPGYHVYRHCTEYTSTTCAPCPQSSYTEAHNGLESCRTCAVCDSSAGVRVKKNCTNISDTLCEPLEGHYCTDPIKDDCQGAVKHTKCKPGQYIKLPGSASSDTVCSDCSSDTYSDGSFTSCIPHTQCRPGYDVVRPGSSASDTECQTISTVLKKYKATILFLQV
ncbi:tumor necrosis factor receptor superfamily member 14-like [Engraulis encrasicolus]|uniref:tumor necrosis factor receptor superfamily member 14-like n=1 Tax=Engraulis encrasicolus TaxID=184585 RepID=UPI002FD153BB